MSSSTKIIIFRLREIIYTVLLVFFVILLVVCLVLMFRHGSGNGADMAQSETMQSDTSQSDTMQSDTMQSDTMQSGAAQNSTAQSGAAQDDAETASVESYQTAQAASAGTGTYTAGVYTSSVTLGDSAVDVQVTVSSDSIRSIELVNLSEATAAAYPLVSSSFENIVSQILEKQKLDGITCSAENRYTSQLLLNAISKALKIAQNTD